MGEQEQKDDALKMCARIVYYLTCPYLIPLISFFLLLFCTYLNNLPLAYRWTLLGIAASFSILIPLSGVFLYKAMYKLSWLQLRSREKRYYPYLLMIISYIFFFVLMVKVRLPWYLTGIPVVVLLILVISLLVNLKWKLSEHAIGMGAIIGGIISYSLLIGFNPLWWLSLFIFISGCVGTAVLILGHHSQWEVYGGFVLGYVCVMLVLDPIINFPFRVLLLLN